MPRKAMLGVGIAAVVALGAIAAIGGIEGDSGGGSCAGGIEGLTPSGSGAEAFTMGIRVNDASDVEAIERTIGDRVLPRDVFLINTEFAGGGPEEWHETLEKLGDTFECNRIAALNGLSRDSTKPGYIKALASEERVQAVLLDWEPDTWEGAGRGAWNPSLERNLARIEQMHAEIESELRAGDTSMGIVPDYLPPWDYGNTAKLLGLLNYRINPEFRGFQIVQTQPNCGDPGAPGPPIAALADDLRKQYRPLFALTPAEKRWVKAQQSSDEILQHLGFEIAFSTSPNASSSEAVERTGPEQAANCSKQIVDSGGAGILYWASADSLKAMLDTPAGHQIRPPNIE